MVRVLWLWANMYSDASNKYKVNTAKEADYMINEDCQINMVRRKLFLNRPTTLRFARRLGLHDA